MFYRHPALWVGSILLVSVGLALGWGFSLIPWALLLLYPWLKRRQWVHLSVAILVMGLTYSYTRISSPKFFDAELAHGIGYFIPREIKEEESPFGKHMVYIGTMSHFQNDEKEIARNLPCRVYIKEKKYRHLANCHYLIEGKIIAKNHQNFVCKTDNKPWQRVDGTFSFAEWRYKAKEKLHRYLEGHFAPSRSLALFSALTLGTIDDRQLVNDFRQLGLSHILAISGFHFALGAGLLLIILRPFFPKKISSLLALILLSYYAFLLGMSPSVLRAWAAISLVLTGHLLGYRTTGLNALGVGLIAELLFDPLLAANLGFELSFLATAAILLLYSPCEKLAQKVFLHRPLKELETMSFIDRHLYLLTSYLRKALALNTAVHVVVLPVCLLHFQSFPLISYLYNLFYPLLISISMTALMAASAIDLFLPWLGGALHRLNALFTEEILQIISHPPAAWTLPSPQCGIPSWFFSLWALLLVAICFHFDKKRRVSL